MNGPITLHRRTSQSPSLFPTTKPFSHFHLRQFTDLSVGLSPSINQLKPCFIYSPRIPLNKQQRFETLFKMSSLEPFMSSFNKHNYSVVRLFISKNSNISANHKSIFYHNAMNCIVHFCLQKPEQS